MLWCLVKFGLISDFSKISFLFNAKAPPAGWCFCVEKKGKEERSGGCKDCRHRMKRVNRCCFGQTARRCGIPVNLNLLLKGIEDPVVFLFQTAVV